jgi:hypothetical protein
MQVPAVVSNAIELNSYPMNPASDRSDGIEGMYLPGSYLQLDHFLPVLGKTEILRLHPEL